MVVETKILSKYFPINTDIDPNKFEKDIKMFVVISDHLNDSLFELLETDMNLFFLMYPSSSSSFYFNFLIYFFQHACKTFFFLFVRYP